MTAVSDIPVSDVDLFDDAARRDPYPAYRALRDAGPVVYMARHGHYALSRYDDVRAALMDWRVFSSARSVFVDEEMNANLEGITLCSDPPDHTMMRSVLGRPLRPDRMREIAPTIAAEADRVVDRVVAAGRFDAVSELAEHLPMAVVSTLVGLGEEHRGKMLEWAAAIWDVQGPRNRRFLDAGAKVAEFLAFAEHDAVPGRIDPDGWAAHLYQAADRGEMPREKCPVMMLDYVTPSLDTTILGIASMVALFAEHPEQWDLLRSDRSLIPHAINEVLRLETSVPQFTRVVTEDHEVGGVAVPAGARVALLYGSANRDERHYPDPDHFDITRKPSDHLAFGRGEHVCVGMHLARLEMSSLLERLADRVARFEVLAATPLLNNGLRGHARLDVRCIPAGA
jgi:cytochrome P450